MAKKKKISSDMYAYMRELIQESLRDWFKKEDWVRIASDGSIAGPCGTSKNKKNPDRCLPRKKAQSLTKGERAATASKKKKAGSKGKTIVKNTKKATVKKETKGAPDGHYFTKSGNLVKGRISKDAKERGARLSDPKDKQRSKVPKVTQYTETSNPQDGKAAPYGSGYKPVTKEDLTNLVVGMIHEINSDNKQVNFGYDLEAIQAVVDYLKSNYKEGIDYEFHIGRGDDLPNAITFKNPSLQKDYDLNDMLNVAQSDEDRYDAYTDDDLNEKKDDRCTRIAKSKYDTWPSAYASGAVVRCRRGDIWKNEK